jgi:hypothetical protein
MLRRLLIVLVGFVLLGSACATMPEAPVDDEAQSGGGGVSPVSVTQGFFDDLEKALKDTKLTDEDARDGWVERLAGSFAPNERDAQRIALSDALTSFANDRAQLGADEELTIEFRFDQPQQALIDDTHALVHMPNASIFMQIARMTDRGPVAYYEQPISLDRVIGRSDGSVPTVKIGNRWFLTEG